MVGVRSGVLSVFAFALLTVSIISPPLRAQARTAAENLNAGVEHLQAGDFLMGLMTLNEVVSPAANAEAAMVARAHAYRAQANLGLDQPERARAAALLALKADPAIVVGAPPFSPAVAALFEELRRPSTANPETAGQAAEKSGRYQEAFLAYLNAFERLPDPAPAADDRRLRERIIAVVGRLETKPLIPPDATAHFTQATALLEAELVLGSSGTGSSETAAAELKNAVRLAPWWPEATLKLATVLQKLQRLDEAVINLNLYRLADPEGYTAAISAKSGAPAEKAPARIAPAAPPAPVAPPLASIYIYWPRQARGNGTPKVLCDGFHVADLKNRHFVLLNVTPGVHNIQVDKRALPVSFEAGQTYYVRAYVGGYPARRQARQVASDEGTSELNDKDMSANEARRTYSSECNAGAGSRNR